MIDERAARAIEASDTDELVRVVDGHCAARAWDALVELRQRCDEAVTRGKQLWGITEYVRYRLALDAPGPWAGPAVTEGPTRFTLGPLAEVAASTKSWAELDPHLEAGPARSVVAQERVVRGEILDDAAVDHQTIEVPLHIEAWEPVYPLVTYHPDSVDDQSPPTSTPPVVELAAAPRVVEDPEGTAALLSVVEHWVESSNGRAEAVCVEGGHREAVRALGVGRAGLVKVSAGEALAHIAWAAATGAAHARRRGAGAGRWSAWWVASALTGLEWPPDPAALGEAVAGLSWASWWDGTPSTGWILRISAESRLEGLAWALAAVDAE